METLSPYVLVGLDKERTVEDAQKEGLNPGAFLFGVMLFGELIGNTPKEPHDLCEAVATLGEIPFVAPEWTEGLVVDLQKVIESVIRGSSSTLTAQEIAKLLADGLNVGYLADYDRLNRALSHEETGRFKGQNTIHGKLTEIAKS